MTAKFFVDTNILLYAASRAADDRSKRQIARDLLQRSDFALSAQVLQEFYVVAIARHRLEITEDEAVVVLQSLEAYPVCPITGELVMEAVKLRQRYQISYWDAAIIAAARTMGCGTVYSEDLSDGQAYDGVTVVNPFKAPGQATTVVG
jgi:predicted nucleic acid-binding protein